jgi:predicted MFS family arabinose efflux permease
LDAAGSADLSAGAVPAQAVPPFGALRSGDFRFYFATAVVAMSADSVEHAITYWLIFERFNSPALAGFAVISHWAPFLVLGITFGALADRYDCRRITQAAQGLLVSVSLGWAVLYLTGALAEWHAVVLLIVHGIAGALWAVSGQLFVYDMVGATHLESAVRLNATARQLGIFLGAALGGALLLTVGPANGLFVNCLLFVPIVFWLFRTPYTGHLNQAVRAARGSFSLGDAWSTLREVARHRIILSMVLLGGATSLLVGFAYQPLLPQYAA